jgi:hypothetical protein
MRDPESKKDGTRPSFLRNDAQENAWNNKRSIVLLSHPPP